MAWFIYSKASSGLFLLQSVSNREDPTGAEGCSSLGSFGGPFGGHSKCLCSEILLLNVVENEAESLSLLSVGSDGESGGTSDLSGVTLNVVLAESEPLTEGVAGWDSDKWGSSLLGQSLYQNN